MPIDIPEPQFFADFNHQVKTVRKAVHPLASLPQKEFKVTKDIVAQMKLYWGSMLKQIRYLHQDKDKEDIKRKVLAPIGHFFNSYQYYDEKWCYVLKVQKENKHYLPENKKPLYDKINNVNMHRELKSSH